ncbi:MAG TPA: ComEC/Rec2 family competence protein [Kiloniellales bacterium]
MTESDRLVGNGQGASLGFVPGAAARARAWLARQLSAERERWVLWLPVAYGVGTALYFWLPQEPSAMIGAAGVSAAVAAGVGLRHRGQLLILALALGAVAVGFAMAQWHGARTDAPVLIKRLGPTAVSGEVHDVSAPGIGTRLILRRLEIPALAPEATPARVRVRIAGGIPENVKPGDQVRLRAVLQPPPGPSAPGAFDFARQAYFQRIGAVGYAVSAVTPIEDGEARSPPPAGPSATALIMSWQTAWARWRQVVARRVLAVLPDAEGGIAAALMTGERGAIPPEVIAAMRDSGLAHLLAISGLHMGLVAGWLFFGVRAALALVPAIALRHPIKKWAALAAVVGGFGYLLLVGATVPAQRAFVMVLLVLLAVLLDRTAISLRLVAWAAFVILAVAPDSLFGASFQMSFAAVAALVASYEYVARKGWFRVAASVGGWPRSDPQAPGASWIGRVALYLASVLLTSVIAILATAPFAIYHFNRMAWFGLAANLIAVPLTALWIMPWALMAFVLMPFGLEALALVPMGWGTGGVIAVAQTVAAWRGAVTPVEALPPAGLALVVAGGLWLCIWHRAWRLAGLVAIAAGLMSLAIVRPPDVLVSGDAKLLGIRSASGELWVSSGRVARYTAETWARRAGVAAPRVWETDGPAAERPQAEGQLRCDGLACLFHARGQLVALVNDSRALAEDCAAATVVIALEPVPDGACPGPRLVIDRFDLWRNGAYALWLSPDGIEVRSVREVSGERPWVRRPETARDDGGPPEPD